MTDNTPTPTPPLDFPNIGELLRRMDVWLDKRKGQHYLRHQEICRDIAELTRATKDDAIIEVGAGTGNLSVELASRAGRVLSVELEETFAEWHDYLRASQPTLTVRYGDFLEYDLEGLVGDVPTSGNLIAAGNLPYQITSEILFRFIDSTLPFRRMVFMIQKEVAERIVAGPANRSSGALTYKIAFAWEASLAFHVGPECFLPPPKVDSSVIVLERKPEAVYTSREHRARLHRLVDGLFKFRRKTLSNGLMMCGAAADRSAADAALAGACIDTKRRVETLSLAELVALEGCLFAGRSAQ